MLLENQNPVDSKLNGRANIREMNPHLCVHLALYSLIDLLEPTHWGAAHETPKHPEGVPRTRGSCVPRLTLNRMSHEMKYVEEGKRISETCQPNLSTRIPEEDNTPSCNDSHKPVGIFGEVVLSEQYWDHVARTFTVSH